LLKKRELRAASLRGHHKVAQPRSLLYRA
jgi:hypothetical protein